MRRATVVIIVYCLKSRAMVRRATRYLKPCDRLSSPMSVMRLDLMIRANKMRVIVYPPKERVILRRAARYLSPCDRLSSPASVMLGQLIRGNKINNSCHYSLPDEIKTDAVKSCKMLEAL